MKRLALSAVPAIEKALYGESIREIGILVLVFVPLDALIEATRTNIDWARVHYWVIAFLVVAGISLIYSGIAIEADAKRAKEEANDSGAGTV